MTEFGVKRQTSDGLNPYCKTCIRMKNRARYERDRELILNKQREWYQGLREDEKDLIRAKDRERYARTYSEVREDQRWSRLLHRYGVTRAQYEAMLDAQGGTCAMCGEPPGERRLSVDHDHQCCPGLKSCGRCVRGLVCQVCNTRVGILESAAAWVPDAEAYLRQFGVEVSLEITRLPSILREAS